MSKAEKAGELVFFDSNVSEIAQLTTQFDVIRFMRRVTEAYGFRAFMVMNLPPVTSRELSQNSIITSWSAELMALFDGQGMMQTSPMLKWLRGSTLPYSIDLGHSAYEYLGPVVLEAFRKSGLGRGLAFPVHDANGVRGAVLFTGDADAAAEQQVMELCYISIHVYDRLAKIRNLDVKSGGSLSDREIDCLNWTAAGKTSAEIAEILGLSEHTVNHYLNRAARKLDTVNRTQAVAKALRTGVIK